MKLLMIAVSQCIFLKRCVEKIRCGYIVITDVVTVRSCWQIVRISTFERTKHCFKWWNCGNCVAVIAGVK